MDDQPAKKPSDDSINKIDLSALETFEFGTQWSEASSGAREDHPPESRTGRSRPSAPGTAPGRRDRRPPRRRTEGGGGRGGPPGASGERRERFDRGSRPSSKGGSREGGERGRRPRSHTPPPRPYESPVLEVTFYPDDHVFNALVKAMRASCRTYELFEIARLILGKPERCVVVFRRRKGGSEASPGPLFVSVPDSMPFETEDEAVRHALERHMDHFFAVETVEVEPPKGNFQFVNRCPVTKQLLGPPNYHRYPHILQHHYDTHSIRMPFEEYKALIEVVREPEAVQEWIELARKATRFTFKGPEGGDPVVFDSPEEARTHLLSNCREQIVKTADSTRLPGKVVTEAGQCEAARAFRGALEDQRRFPLETANALRGRLRRENFHIFKRGSKGVTYVCSVRRRFRKPGEVFSESITKLVEFLDQHPRISIADLPEKYLGFSLPHGPPVSTQPAAAGTDSHSDTRTETEGATGTSEEVPAGASHVTETEPASPDGSPAEAAAKEESHAEPAPQTSTPAREVAALPPEQKSALDRMLMDLRWLVGEGYVAEYSDGRLFVHAILEPAEPRSPDRGPRKERADAAPADRSEGRAGPKSEPAESVAESEKPVAVPGDAEPTSGGGESAEPARPESPPDEGLGAVPEGSVTAGDAQTAATETTAPSEPVENPADDTPQRSTGASAPGGGEDAQEEPTAEPAPEEQAAQPRE